MVELNSTAKIQKKSAVCKFFVLKFSVFQNFFCDLNLVLDVRSHVTSMLGLVLGLVLGLFQLEMALYIPVLAFLPLSMLGL